MRFELWGKSYALFSGSPFVADELPDLVAASATPPAQDTPDVAGQQHALPPSPEDRASPVATLVLISVAGLLVSLTQSLLIPVLPMLTANLHTSATNVEWLLTSTLLVAAVAVPVVGRLADLFGKKRLLVISLAAFVAGSLLCALTSSLGLLIAGRAVTGLSMAAIPLGISLVSAALPPERARSGIALISAMLGIGGALGLPIAGAVAEHADYHILFWICVAGGVACLAGTAYFVPEAPVLALGKMDVGGSVLLGAALIALLLPLSEAGVWGWGDPKTAGLLAAAVVLFAVFAVVEQQRSSPVIDLRVNARPPLLLTNIASVAVGFALFAVLLGTASYVQAPPSSGYGFGSSILVGGLCLLPSGIFMLLLSLASPKISARFGPKVTLALGAFIVGLGFVERIVLTSHLWEVLLGTTLAGMGTGIAYAAMPSLILLAAPPSELAAANGLNSLARSIGSSLASALGGTILAASTITIGGYALPSLTAYRILFAVCAAAALLGAAIALVIPKSAPPQLSGDQ
jgi:MFS family permease